MKRAHFDRFLSVLLALCLLAAVFVTAFAAVPTEAQAYERMIALREQYPEGTPWTDENYYPWKGGIYTGGSGCAAFVFLLSDAAFGDLPARMIDAVRFDRVRVGDILRVNGNTHSVIVLTVGTKSVTVAEGNYNSAVHWGRTLTAAQVEQADYMLTRYPEDEPAPAPVPPADAMTDVRRDWTWEGINYCLEHGLMTGVSARTFSPDGLTTRGMLMTILARASGLDTEGGPTWYHKGMVWAMANNVSDGTDPEGVITREQLVTMLYRQSDSPAAGLSALDRFPDSASVSPWARDAVAWAVRIGILNGADGRLDPQGGATRAQTAAMLMRWQNLTA